MREEIQLAKAQADEQDKQLQKAWRETEARSRRYFRGMLLQTRNDVDAIKDMQLQQEKRQAGQLFFIQVPFFLYVSGSCA